MGAVIAVEAVAVGMLLVVLNGWRIQFREWRVERRSAEAGQLQVEDEETSEQDSSTFSRVISRSR